MPGDAIRDLERPTTEEAALTLRKSFPMPSSWAQYLPETVLRPGGALRGLILLEPGSDGQVRMKSGKILRNEPGIGIVVD